MKACIAVPLIVVGFCFLKKVLEYGFVGPTSLILVLLEQQTFQLFCFLFVVVPVMSNHSFIH